MNFIQDPMEIERRSMEIILPYLDGMNLNEAQVKVFSRVIHAAGDPDYANHIRIGAGAIEAGIAAIRRGEDVYCDVEMVRTGISKKNLTQFGGKAHCLIADPAVAALAKELGITRSMAAFRLFGTKMGGAIVAVGNAPTALYELLRLMKEEAVRPALIIGAPVGFVGAAESKAQLMEKSLVPLITVLGSKGGSPIAAAVFNALLYMAGSRI